MARKHNTKHQRARSRYRARLSARRQSPTSVRMEDAETLHKRQERNSGGYAFTDGGRS